MRARTSCAALAALASTCAAVARELPLATPLMKHRQDAAYDARRYLPAALDAAAVQLEVFVSPNGSDTSGDGSYAAPYLTIQKAQSVVEVATPSQSGDIVVWFRAGQYPLTQMLNFGLADGGNNGYTVRYAAWPSDSSPAVWHGARAISGWTSAAPLSSDQPLWTAPAGPSPSRQLFVDNVRAQRAGFSVSSFSFAYTEDGYTVPAGAGGQEILAWWAAQPADGSGNKEPFELVYTGSGSTWTEPRCRTTSITGMPDGTAVINVSQPCYSNGRNRGAAWQHMTVPVSIENVYAGLTQPGTYILSGPTSTLYYAPYPGQDMGSAQAYLPILEQLMNISGTFDHKAGTGTRVQGLSFEGITFAYSTWLLPNTGVGFVDNQGPDIYLATGTALIPAALQVHGGTRISFTGCTLYGLGSTGLAVDGGSQGVTFVNGTVNQVAGVGIQLGQVDDGSQWNPSLRNGGHTIFNSFFLNTPAEYHGGSPIFGGYLVDTTYEHNYLLRPPNGGICSGWGWGDVNNSYSGNVSILYNRVEGSNWKLKDCGSYYVNGHNTGSVSMGNYALDQVMLFGALYPDEGSTNWYWANNVAENVPEPVHIWTISIVNITMTQNWWGPSNKNTLNGTDMHVYNNTWVQPGMAWPPEAEAVKAFAGLLPLP